MNHAALAGVVADQAVVFAVELLARAVCGTLDRRSPGASLDLSDVEVIKRHSLTVLGQHGFDLGQVEYALRQLIKLAFTHVFDGWRNALNHRALNNEPPRPLLALAVLQILNLLFDTLVAVFGLA